MILWILIAVLLVVIGYDIFQRKHAILHNYPIIGHFRYLLEAIGPELRQYIVTNNDEERPFNRDQRRWVYASSKKQNNYFGFGSDNDQELSPHYLIIKHKTLPKNKRPLPELKDSQQFSIPCAKILGAWRGREKQFRPSSVVNISAMSYGSLSKNAVSAINKGCALADCLHNTGEGGIAPAHGHGGSLIWQIGTGYFGCRNSGGGFSLENFCEVVASHNVKAIEIKLSQGAKPGRGGVLPAAKVSAEIARIRGIPVAKSCISPAYHSAFSDVPGLIDFVETLARETGLPVGIKSAVGDLPFWQELAETMAKTERGVDFISIDGGEGGTGAAPLVFSDHVSLPFKLGFTQVYKEFAVRELHNKVLFIGSGKLGFPQDALLAFGLGCDMIAVGREAMLAIGCIQAQRCHTGHCPAGVATQSDWLMRGLDPEHKGARLANYVLSLRKELLWLSHACGVPHPSLVGSESFSVLDDRFGAQSATELFGYEASWQTLAENSEDQIWSLMDTAQEVS